MLPLLWLVQQNQGYISPEAEAWVGPHRRGVTLPRARGGLLLQHVPHPTGRPARASGLHEFAVPSCAGPRTCWSGSRRRLKIGPGETTPGQEVTLTEVECLCACEMAPMAQLDERFVGPLEGETVDSVHPGRARGIRQNRNRLPEPEPYICSDGPVLSTRFKNPDGTWFDRLRR